MGFSFENGGSQIKKRGFLTDTVGFYCEKWVFPQKGWPRPTGLCTGERLPAKTPPSNDPAETLPRQENSFPRLVFVVSPLKFSLPRQNYSSFIVDNSLKFHFPVMIFLIPAENVCFRNFPAVFTRSGGVVTGGCAKGAVHCFPTHFASCFQ